MFTPPDTGSRWDGEPPLVNPQSNPPMQFPPSAACCHGCRLSSLLYQSKQLKQRQLIAPKSEALNLPGGPNPKSQSQSPRILRGPIRPVGWPAGPTRRSPTRGSSRIPMSGARPVGGAACSTNRSRSASKKTSAKERSPCDAGGPKIEVIKSGSPPKVAIDAGLLSCQPQKWKRFVPRREMRK